MAKTNGFRKIGIISGVVITTLTAMVIYTSVVLFAGEQSRNIDKVGGRVDVIEAHYENVERRLDRQEVKLDHIIELLAGKDK